MLLFVWFWLVSSMTASCVDCVWCSFNVCISGLWFCLFVHVYGNSCDVWWCDFVWFPFGVALCVCGFMVTVVLAYAYSYECAMLYNIVWMRVIMNVVVFVTGFDVVVYDYVYACVKFKFEDFIWYLWCEVVMLSCDCVCVFNWLCWVVICRQLDLMLYVCAVWFCLIMFTIVWCCVVICLLFEICFINLCYVGCDVVVFVWIWWLCICLCDAGQGPNPDYGKCAVYILCLLIQLCNVLCCLWFAFKFVSVCVWLIGLSSRMCMIVRAIVWFGICVLRAYEVVLCVCDVVVIMYVSCCVWFFMILVWSVDDVMLYDCASCCVWCDDVMSWCVMWVWMILRMFVLWCDCVWFASYVVCCGSVVCDVAMLCDYASVCVILSCVYWLCL